MRQLKRPLDRLVLVGDSLTSEQLELILAIPAEFVGMHQVKAQWSESPTIKLPPARELSISNCDPKLAVKLAQWKRCSSLLYTGPSLPLDQCLQLAQLDSLEELHLEVGGFEEAKALLQSPSLRTLSIRAKGLSETEVQQIKSQVPLKLKLTIH